LGSFFNTSPNKPGYYRSTYRSQHELSTHPNYPSETFRPGWYDPGLQSTYQPATQHIDTTLGESSATFSRDSHSLLTLNMMQTISFHAMGCQMMAAIDSQRPSHLAQLEKVPTWFETWEQRLSRFRPESELNQVNRGNGTQKVSSLLAEVLQVGQRAQRQSGGLINPLILDDLEGAGYDRNFTDLIEEKVAIVDYPRSVKDQQLKLDFHRRLINRPVNSHMDLGGITKGWAADRATRRLGKLAPVLIDAGGDVSVSGPQTDGSPWPVGVADPHHPDQLLDTVLLMCGGVATSGRDYRRWRRNGSWQHHIIDPRTNSPAQTDVLSATVVAPSACLAEIAAKTMLIRGSVDGLKWLETWPNFAGLVVLDDGTALHSRRWLDHIWR
jgi:thiamine biosynthesis lipoprotein